MPQNRRRTAARITPEEELLSAPADQIAPPDQVEAPPASPPASPWETEVGRIVRNAWLDQAFARERDREAGFERLIRHRAHAGANREPTKAEVAASRADFAERCRGLAALVADQAPLHIKLPAPGYDPFLVEGAFARLVSFLFSSERHKLAARLIAAWPPFAGGTPEEAPASEETRP